MGRVSKLSGEQIEILTTLYRLQGVGYAFQFTPEELGLIKELTEAGFVVGDAHGSGCYLAGTAIPELRWAGVERLKFEFVRWVV